MGCPSPPAHVEPNLGALVPGAAFVTSPHVGEGRCMGLEGGRAAEPSQLWR